jgi:hypothetical protein
MATYLYCVLTPATADALPAGLKGLGGSPIRWLAAATLEPMAAWVATIDESSLRHEGVTLTADALLHNQVVNVALASGEAVLPARFGTLFADDLTCEKNLVDERQNLLATLDRVSGSVEIPVLIVPTGSRHRKPQLPDRQQTGVGRRYLEAARDHRLEQARRHALLEAQADRVTNSVGEMVRGEARTIDSRGILSLVHLVPKSALQRYRQAIDEIQPERGVRIVIGDLRAPYSFTNLKSVRTGHDSGSPSNND